MRAGWVGESRAEGGSWWDGGAGEGGLPGRNFRKKATARSCAVWKSMRKALRLHKRQIPVGRELA